MLNSKPFSLRDVEEIIEETIHTPKGRKVKFSRTPDIQKMVEDLNRSYRFYLGWKRLSQFPTKREMLDYLEGTKKRSQNLTRNCSDLIGDIERMASLIPTYNLIEGLNVFDDALDVLEKVENEIDCLSEMVSVSDHTGWEGGSIAAETDFIGRLLPEVYERYFGENVTLSANSPSGRFIDACLQRVAMQRSPETIKSNIRNCRKAALNLGETASKK